MKVRAVVWPANHQKRVSVCHVTTTRVTANAVLAALWSAPSAHSLRTFSFLLEIKDRQSIKTVELLDLNNDRIPRSAC